MFNQPFAIVHNALSSGIRSASYRRVSFENIDMLTRYRRYYTLGPFAQLELEMVEARRLIPAVSGIIQSLGSPSVVVLLIAVRTGFE